MVIRQDVSESKWWAIWQLSPFMPNYHKQLFKFSKSLFNGLFRQDLSEELDKQLAVIERRMGVPISYVYWTYENLPALNSFTKSRAVGAQGKYIYKHTMKTWLEKIEDWTFDQIAQLEPEIRFTQLKVMT